MRKYISELIGTCVLVVMGCGTAMLVGTEAGGGGYLLTALAFGLSVIAMAYSIGNISGGHVNPAISLAAFIRGDLTGRDFAGYVVAQVLGGLAGALLLMAVFGAGGVPDATGSFASNGLSGVDGSALAGIVVEIMLTFVFVTVFLGATSKSFEHGSVAGLVIGLSLTLVHILGIGLTGTSVNPARSLGPALAALATGNTAPIEAVWVFILAPLIGAAIAAVVYKWLEREAQITSSQVPDRAAASSGAQEAGTARRHRR